MKCPKCEFLFDVSSRKPIILTQCGHTFCSLCLNEMANQNQIVCPLDGRTLNISNPSLLPTNEMIVMIIKDQSKMCKTHSKYLEYFCLEERVEICSLCAIIGGHNTHTKKVITFAQLKNYIQNIVISNGQKALQIRDQWMNLDSLQKFQDSKIQKTILQKK